MRIFMLVLFFTGVLSAHNLKHTLSWDESVTITLQFVKEGDFSFQSYEVYAPKTKIPFQVGRSDVQGRVVFLPNSSGKWLVKIFSEDGHGKIIEVDIDKNNKGQKIVQNTSILGRLLWGFLLLFSVFGVMYFTKRKKN